MPIPMAANPSGRVEVGIWLDPVCPFSWNTARWLDSAVPRSGQTLDWQLMNLHILNQGREVPPHLRQRMDDSQKVGRLMAAVDRELGQTGLRDAYLAFGKLYFDQSEPLSIDIADRVLAAVSARETTSAAMADSSLDKLVRTSHESGQDALGDVGGSPLVRLRGRTFFGPVLTSLPAQEDSQPLLRAITQLAGIPEFTQFQRPRPAH